MITRSITIRNSICAAIICIVAVNLPGAPKNIWADRVLATYSFMQKHMWNAATGNFVRRADQPSAPGSDSWGITIVLDAYAYMVEGGFMKPEELKRYYQSSSSLYEKTSGSYGARIMARQGDQIYVGGDDDLQWTSALVHCYLVTKDSEYLNAARYAFNALLDLGFWIDGASKGWAWNSADRRPNGVSTAYGALAAARLFQATGEPRYKEWAAASLNALKTPQVGFFPRDMMVASDAALTIYEITHDAAFLDRAEELEAQAIKGGNEVLAGKAKGERNPTDIGDVADGLYHFYGVTKNPRDLKAARTFLFFFAKQRTPADISEHGFYSRYQTNGQPDLTGAYLGVPLSVAFLPEVAEMLKLFAVAYKYER